MKKSAAACLYCLLFVLLGLSPSLHATDLKLASIFSDHMVLQREKPVTIWGWTDAGEAVTVTFSAQSKSATADADGKWVLKLDPLTASSEPRILTASDNQGHRVEVKDILVGEVWLGSGQSNMEMSVQASDDAEAEKAAANFPLIRYYGESSGPAETGRAVGKGAWQECNPTNVRRFSAVLYFFGRQIHREVGVPVGLINSSAGATQIEYWVPAGVQTVDPETKANYEALLKGYTGFDEVKVAANYEKQLESWKLAAAQATAEKKEPPARPFDIVAARKRKGPPAGLYNGKIHNLVPFTLRGVLWYQGESNAGNPALYGKLLAQLVTAWRALWNEELPFAWVQLPNFTAPGEGWPRMREAMLKTLNLPKTGMAVTIDIGDAKNIHPTNKQEVGRRLSLWALGTIYGKPVPAISGPLPESSSVAGDGITVTFRHADGGLKTKDGGPVRGFQIAGLDRHWKTASAHIEGNKVVVASAEVPSPVAVRYAWQDLPDFNLFNAADLPASPFRTDDWPAIAPFVK